MVLSCCLTTFPISHEDPALMSVLASTNTEVLLYDYSEEENFFVLVLPPELPSRTLFFVGRNYAYQWFGLNGSQPGYKIVYNPFLPFPNLHGLTNPCHCPPVITRVNPNTGAAGITIEIDGLRFTGVTQVEFGGTPATDFTFINDTEILAEVPAGTGTVDVSVTTTGGTSAISLADQFTYTLPITAPFIEYGYDFPYLRSLGKQGKARSRAFQTEFFVPFVQAAMGNDATWDPLTVENVSLSGGNLTATNTGDSNVQGVKATVSETTGKYYFEVTCTSTGTTSFETYDFGVGSSTYNDFASSAGGGVGVDRRGVVYSNFSNSGFALNLGATGLQTGDVVGVAVDLTNRSFWVIVQAGPSFPNPLGWNGATTSNPATNTLGAAIPAGTMTPTFVFNDDVLTQSMTINFGGAAFSGSVPVGFTAGWPSGGSPASLDPATINKVVLSNSNHTVTNNAVLIPEQGAKVAASSGKTSGKYYFEITAVTQNDGDCSFGVATTSATYAAFAVDGTGGVICFENGVIFTNGSNSGDSADSISQGDIAAVAVDLDNRQIWFEVVGGPSGWNGNPTNDPAANVGGVAVLAGTIVPMATFGGNLGDVSGNVFTANFGGSAFTGTVPTGFTAGWPA